MAVICLMRDMAMNVLNSSNSAEKLGEFEVTVRVKVPLCEVYEVRLTLIFCDNFYPALPYRYRMSKRVPVDIFFRLVDFW